MLADFLGFGGLCVILILVDKCMILLLFVVILVVVVLEVTMVIIWCSCFNSSSFVGFKW